MNTAPLEIRRNGSTGLQLTWSDGSTMLIGSATLRRNCPCAECRERRGDSSHAAPLTTARPTSLKIVSSSSKEEEELARIWGIGNYALGIEWGDGHSTGIYTFDLLRELGETQGT